MQEIQACSLGSFLLEEEVQQQNNLKDAIRQFSFQPFEKVSDIIVYDKNQNETI